MVKKKPPFHSILAQWVVWFILFMMLAFGVAFLAVSELKEITPFFVPRRTPSQPTISPITEKIQSTEESKVLGQEMLVNPSAQEAVESHAAGVFSSRKYANLRLENFGKPDYLVAQANGKGVFYLQSGGNVFSEGTFNFAAGVVRGGLRVEGDATVVNNLSIGGDTFKVVPSAGQVSVNGDFRIDGDRTIRGTGSLTINPTGNLYLQSESFLIDENGNLVVANVNAPELEYRGDITLRAKSDKTTTVNITNPHDNYLANLSVEGDISVNGGKVTLASGETIDAESADTLKLTSDGNVAVVLGDTAGQKQLVVYDATGSSQMFAVDSDGNVSAAGGATIAGNVSMSGTLTAGNTEVANFTSAGITALGDSASDTLSIPAGLSTNFVPSTASAYNLGSPSKPFANVYADNLVATATDVSGTKQETFILDTDNTGGNLTLRFGATNNEQLLWDATNSRFRFTDDLLVDDGLTVNGNAIFAAMTPGSIPFFTTGGQLTQNNSQLFWDRNNNKLGIGTATPGADVDIRKTGGGIQWVANSNGNTNLTNGATLGSYEFAGYFNGSVNDVARIRGFYTGDGTTRSGAIGFFTHNLGSTSEKLRITSTGNIGIGTTAPSQLLDVNGNLAITGNDRTLSFRSGAVNLVDVSGNTRYEANGYVELRFDKDSSGAATDSFRITKASGADLLRVDVNGNVGIGTTSPNYKLSISQPVTESTYKAAISIEDTLTRADSSTGIDWRNTQYSWNQGRIAVIRNGTNANFSMAFSTAVNGVLTEGLRLLSNGNVGVGTTSPTSLVHVLPSGTVSNALLTVRGTTTTTSGGVDLSPTISTATTSYGVYAEPIFSPTSNIASANGTLVLGRAQNSSSNITTLRGLYTGVRTSANYTGTLSGTQGILIETPAFSGSAPTTNYGLYIDSQTGGGTNYALYSAGGQSYFAGNVGIGTSSPGTNKFKVENTGLTNDTLSQMVTLSGGTDATLGTLNLGFYFNPSATGTNRYVAVSAGDSGAWRNLALNHNGGNVGVGTTNPSQKMSIAGGSILLDNAQNVYFKDNGGTTRTVLTMTSGNNVQLASANGSIQLSNTSPSGSVQILTNSLERLRVDSNGNVGIGTTSPAEILHIEKLNSGANSVAARLSNPGAGVGNAVSLDFQNFSTSGQSSRIQSYRANAGNFASDLVFYTNDGGSSTGISEKLRILSTGNVGIGTTTPALRLNVTATGSGGYPTTSGTNQTGIQRLEAIGTDNILDMGVAGASPWGSWLQSTNRYNLATVYPLLLNPNGGNVGIGTTSPGGILQVGDAAGTNMLYETAQGTLSIRSTTSDRVQFAQNAAIWSSTNNSGGIRVRGDSTGNYAYITGGSGTSLALNPTVGNVGIGTTSPGEKLEVNGGVRLNTVTAKPTCDSSHRGTFWSTQGGAGVKDNVEVCAKDGTDAYAWRTIY